jgi:hypothetical protein
VNLNISLSSNSVCENALKRESGAQRKMLDEKTRDEKSRETILYVNVAKRH